MFQAVLGLSSWEVRSSQGSFSQIKDGLMGLVTCRSAPKPKLHSATHQWLMYRIRKQYSWHILT